MSMNPFGGPLSPRTQSFAGGGGGGQLSIEDAFNDGFTQMAYDSFTKTHPSMVKDIVSFRVLDADPDDGSGIGVFILSINQEVFYVPVIVADNNIKPIDMFFSRRLNRYFPLTAEWLMEANKSALSELGVGMKPPKDLQNDVDISRVVHPPIGGRFGYAEEAFRTKVATAVANGDLDREAARAFSHALTYVHTKRAAVLPEVLASLPNTVKTAFARVLRHRPSILQKMAAVYGVKNLTSALQLREEKTASEVAPRKAVVVTEKTATHELRKLFGNKTAEAFSAVRTYGFYAQDTRTKTASVYAVDASELHLTQPKTSGVYRVYLTDGSIEEVLVVVSPLRLDSFPLVPYRSRSADQDERATRAQVFFKDGRCMRCVASTFVAEPVMMADDAALQTAIEKWSKDSPANGQHGVFIAVDRGDLIATEPVTVKTSASSGDETAYTLDISATVVVSKKMPGAIVAKPPHGSRTVLGAAFRWLPVDEKWTDSSVLYATPKEVLRAADRARTAMGSKKIAVHRAGSATFYVNNEPRALPLSAAVEKVANTYGVALPAALKVVHGSVLYPTREYWTKVAASDKKPKAGSDGGEGDPAMMDPAMMDPAMMGPPAPPQPSGYELAIAEQLQLIQAQIAALQDKSMTLQQLQMRQQQIDGGGGMMAAPTGAASLMAGAPMGPMGGMPMAPPYAQAGGAPQGMPMDPSMGQMPPGMPPDPSMGQTPPGMPMDPPMGQGTPMDPAMGMGQPMPDPSDPGVMRPVITEQDISSGNVENAINPAFLDQAGELQQSDVFDAAAIASLAQNKNLRSIVQSHLPRAEETMDNVGRMKLLFELREGKIKGAIGNEAYTAMEQNLSDVFSQLGELILKLNQTSDQLLPAALG